MILDVNHQFEYLHDICLLYSLTQIFLDSFVGGGYSEGHGVIETVVKELEEEAGLVMTDALK